VRKKGVEHIKHVLKEHTITKPVLSSV